MGWYEAIKDGLSIAQKADNIELTKQLLEIQKEMQDLQQENFELRKEITELKELDSKEIEYDDNRTAVYEVKEGNKKEGPYCTRCWEVDRKLVSVHIVKKSMRDAYACPQCESEVIIARHDNDIEKFL